jgi:hypothetical protein
MVFWVVMTHSLQKAQHFRGPYFLHLQGPRVSQAGHQHQEGSKQSLAYTLTLKMEAVCSSETSYFLWTTQHYNQEDCTLHSHYCENFKSNVVPLILLPFLLDNLDLIVNTYAQNPPFYYVLHHVIFQHWLLYRYRVFQINLDHRIQQSNQ